MSSVLLSLTLPISGPALAAGVLSRSFGLRSLHLYIRGFPFMFAHCKASICSYYLWIPLYPLVLLDLVRSFRLEHRLRPISPPTWDLVKVLSFFTLSSFLRFCRLTSPLGFDDVGSVFALFGYCHTSRGAPSHFILRVLFLDDVLSLSFFAQIRREDQVGA